MIQEIQAAVEWLTRAIEVNDLSESQLQLFERSLVEALTRKYTDHWYRDMPWRGQGYRSILSEDCAHVVDHVLRHAAREAHITDLPDRMPTEPFVIWVDPGDVEVRFLNSHRSEVLYHQPFLHHAYVAESAYRRGYVTSPSPAEEGTGYNSYGLRPRDSEAYSESNSTLLMSDDGLLPKSASAHQDFRNTSDSAVRISRHGSPPPRGVWGSGSGSFSSKSVSKANHARPRERPSSTPVPSWGAAKASLRAASPVGLAGVV